MSWRDDFKVHPAADVFPMMDDADLAKLAENIKANKLSVPVTFFVPERTIGGDLEYLKANGVLADGRNRLEALERVGIEFGPCMVETVHLPDAASQAAFIIGRNVRRRHMTKEQIADALVAIAKLEEDKPAQDDPVSQRKGGRGKRNPVKAKALQLSKALPEGDQVSEATIKRAIAKAEGKKPAKEKPRPVIIEDIATEIMPDRPRPRRTTAQIKPDQERERFLPWLGGAMGAIASRTVSDTALDQTSEHELTLLAEDLGKAISILTALLERVRERLGRVAAK
jgi:hypothetical protein